MQVSLKSINKFKRKFLNNYIETLLLITNNILNHLFENVDRADGIIGVSSTSADNTMIISEQKLDSNYSNSSENYNVGHFRREL
jgi:hypothetical protein